MNEFEQIDAATVRALAARNGLDLSLERAADLVAPLQVLLVADQQIRAVVPATTAPVGWPWGDAHADLN
jgi:hypothetical protein